MTGSALPPASPPVAVAAPVERGRPGMPSQRTLFAGLLAFRAFLALLLLVGGSLFFWTDRGTSLDVLASVVAALLLTGQAAYSSLVRREILRPLGLFVQSLIDLSLVTALVHFADQSGTAVAALYVVVIAAYAVLLPVGGGVAVALLASGAYLAESVVWPGDVPAGLVGQIGVFGSVFLLVAVLGHRLRDTAAQQSRLETELYRARFEAGEILRSIRAGVLTVDARGRLAFVNPPAERLLELDGDRLTGQPVLQVLAARAPELHEAIVAGLRSGLRVGRGEGTVCRADGGSFPIGLSTTTFERDGGETAVTAIFTDLSELKELQELQFRAERLEAVAALSASLAHEIRNPLASIRSSVEQLAFSAQADEDERILGKLIIRESDRLSRLLGEFLDFSRVRAVNFSTVDLRDVAVQAVAMVREHSDSGGIRIDVQGESTPVTADEDLLHRVVSNLLLNAVQACRGNGHIRVEVGFAADGELPPGAKIDSPAKIVVEDDGPGIDADLRERLFQPFVSGRAGGSGMGLAIVQRAVEAHRGIVMVDSEPGRGARFTVYFCGEPFGETTA